MSTVSADNNSEFEPLNAKGNDISSDLEQHNKMVQETIFYCKAWIVIGTLFNLFYSARAFCWILYSETFGETNAFTLSLYLCLNYFLQGVSAAILGKLGDLYGFDNISIILCITNAIGIGLEAFAYNFSMLAIGLLIVSSFRGLDNFDIAFIAKYLPQNMAIDYTSYCFSCHVGAYLLGPIMAGTLATIISYQMIYIVSFIISIIIVIIIFTIIIKSESKLVSKQLLLNAIYVKYLNSNNKNKKKSNKNDNSKFNFLYNKENLFPLCLIDMDISLNDSKLDSSKDNIDLIALILLLIMNGIALAIEAALASYYTYYCKIKFNSSTLISTSQLSLLLLLCMFGIFLLPKILFSKKFLNCIKISINSMQHLLLLFYHSINIILMAIFFNMINNINYLWIIDSINGITLGIGSMLQEKMILTVQPKQNAGLISGLKIFVRSIFKAITVLIIGYLWNISFNYFAYTQAILYSMSFLVWMLLIFVQCWYKIQL